MSKHVTIEYEKCKARPVYSDIPVLSYSVDSVTGLVLQCRVPVKK